MVTRGTRIIRRHDAFAYAVLAVAIAGLLPYTVVAQQATAAVTVHDFDIPAGQLATSLDRFSAATGLQVGFQPALLAGRQARALQGRLTWQEALDRLLQGTGLEYQQINDRTIVVKGAEGAGGGERPARTPPARQGKEPQAQVATTDLETVVVTGTRIRGGVTPSPVVEVSALRIQEEGFSDLGEVIRSLPQNYSGGQNPGVTFEASTGASGYANNNITGGSGLNLRGLGPDATLTLLNGRRMSYSGFSQAVDISAIPVEAIERIEIVVDGASAIYGSDAVGGVGNVVIKRDYEGVVVGARYGGATDGGLITKGASITAGTTWSDGGVIATFQGVSTDPIYANQRYYTDYLLDPTTIYPGGDLKSGLMSLHQSFGDFVRMRVDALMTVREQDSYREWGTYYLFNKPKTTTLLASPTVEVALPKDWTLTLGGTYGKDENEIYATRTVYSTGVETLDTDICYCNESRTYEIGAEGALFDLSGGQVRLAVGAGYRTNEFVQANYRTDTIATQGTESGRFAYAELNIPLVGPSSGVPGVQRLALVAAARAEDYDSFGRVTTPKLGLIYGPSQDFTLKASWGKSFKAPTLYQRYYAQPVYLLFPTNYGGVGYASDATVMIVDGGNSSLRPERAKSWSASLAFHPEALPGLEAELTWFDIDYTDRVVQPITNWSQAMSNPNYAEFVQYEPTVDEQAQVIASATNFYNRVGAAYDPSKVVAIIYAQYTNANRQRIRGVDLSGSYRFDLGEGRMTIRGSASRLDMTQQTAGAPNAYEVSGTLYNPAKLTGRVGAVWDQRGFTASVFGNYVDGVRDTVNSRTVASFTTVDLTLRYVTGERDGAWSGLEFALAAQNVLDRAPPLHAVRAANYIPYDPTNYSAVGRFLNFSVSKKW